MMMTEPWTAERTTREVTVAVSIGPPGTGIEARTGRPMLDHLVTTLIFCAGWSGTVTASAAVDPDGHHLFEDVAIAVGSAVATGLSRMKGAFRYGWAAVPMDDALARVAVDIGGRPGHHVSFPRPRPRPDGDWGWDSVVEMWAGLARGMGATIHVDGLRGQSAHHLAEAMAKAGGLALAQATQPSAAVRTIKGVL